MNIKIDNPSNFKRVVAGISGGPDSVALLRLLTEAGVEVYAVHCNFHLRGEESDRDERFVTGLCASLHVPLRVLDFDVEEHISNHGGSVEMACRELRYEKFHELRESLGADRIAVGHNADDNVETFFLNLMRGCGLRGLCAMKEDTGLIWRPLINYSKEQILDYLRDIGQDYVTDSTNLDSEFRRNFLRNKVLPLLRQEWPEAQNSILSTVAHLREEAEVLQHIELQSIREDSTFLPYSTLREHPDPLWLLSRFVRRFGGNSSQALDIFRHISNSDLTSGKRWTVKGGNLYAEREGIEFVGDEKPSVDFECYSYETDARLLAGVRGSSLTEFWTTLPPERVRFRRVETGDRIKPLGMKGSMLVSKIMKDAKLSQREKDRCMVAQDSQTGDILWVSGLKRSRFHLVDGSSLLAYKYVEKKK